jgi:outer membrane protein assembly factor BamB
MLRTRALLVLIVAALALPAAGGAQGVLGSAAGDLFVSLETGPVLWRLRDGSPRGILLPTIVGTGEGLAFDRSGNLYVARWCVDSACRTGNTVERYDPQGRSRGPFGSGYNCNPHAIVFDSSSPGIDTAYVGQAGCRRSILKFVPGQPTPTEFAVAGDNVGVFWMDLAPDRCTIFYTSFGPNVKRFDVCAGLQRPDFNLAPLPGGITQDVRVLDDGGVLVSSGQIIARLNADGVHVQSYEVPGETALWAGLDLAGDGTFWAGNYFSSNVYRFDIASGNALAGFNTGTPTNTVVGVKVKR